MDPSDESSVSFEDDLGEDSDSPGEDVQVKKQTAKSSKSICILLPWMIMKYVQHGAS